MISQCTALQLLVSQAIMAWRYVEDPTVRLATQVKRSVRDQRCRNISRCNRGISWFLGVLFVSTSIVRAAQFSQTSNEGHSGKLRGNGSPISTVAFLLRLMYVVESPSPLINWTHINVHL